MNTLHATIDRLCLSRLGRLPDLDNPIGYNDKIQWLKIHDQMPVMPILCDKHRAREWVAEVCGEEILVPLATGYPRMLKCSHDSGSTIPVDSPEQREYTINMLTPRLSRKYGVDKGEWAYGMIPEPRIVEEAFIPGGNMDYKFHCIHGRIAWVQVIWDRRVQVKECILDHNFHPTGLHMDEKMRHVTDIPNKIRVDLEKMAAVAEKLAAGFRYVRVDLYWNSGDVKFGEMTFWPRSGCYKSTDEPKFGQLLKIDTSYKLPRLV